MRKLRVAFVLLLIIAAAALAVYYYLVHNIPVLEPKGMIAEKERNLILFSSVLMLIIVIPVYILTWVFAWKYRDGNEKEKYTPDWDHNYKAEAVWWGIPIVIILILGVTTYITTYDLNPFKPIVNGKKPLKVQVVALEWKWLFIYPEQRIATVNYLAIPEKTPIEFEITADAPMNSFWIPQLGGQIYAMPAMRTKLYLMANEPGTFRGASSNLSGHGFAGMFFKVVSSTEQDFENWVSSVMESSNEMNMGEYTDLVKPSQYVKPTYYRLMQGNLFDRILEKYMPPKKRVQKSRV